MSDEQTAVFEQPDPHQYDEYAHLPERELGRIPGPVSQRTSAKLREALAYELKDLAGQEINPSNLATISRFAQVANELLMVRDPIAEVRRRKRPRMDMPPMGVVGGLTEYNANYGSGSSSYTSEAAPNETFGAKLIRELVPAFQGLNQKTERSVVDQMSEAIEKARERGLNEVADKIEAKMEKYLEEEFLSDSKPDVIDTDVVENKDKPKEVH